ncbi:MAG: hypothetical protein KAR42_10435 [candidate division Zixibacteria bacterium]|nr:hypothetical protein [candidate division Zixibacteria bacterium]
MKDFTPKISVENGQAKSDVCIWCGEDKNLSDSHIFPAFMGGWNKPRTCCCDCNSYLGRKVEAQVKKNKAIANAIIKLGISDEYNTFKSLRKYDEATGQPVHLHPKGKATIVPKPTDGGIIASLNEAANYELKNFRKRFPNWPTEKLSESLHDPKSGSFSIAGMRFRKTFLKSKKSTIRIELSRYISAEFIFKLVYEYCSLIGIIDNNEFRKFLRGFYVVNYGEKDRIKFSEDISENITSNIELVSRSSDADEKIDFRPYHSFTFRLSREFHFYLEVRLFGIIKYQFILAKWSIENDIYNDVLDRCIIFPTNEDNIYLEFLPNIVNDSLKHSYQYSDILVDTHIQMEKNK